MAAQGNNGPLQVDRIPESVTSKIQPPVSPEFLQYFPETT
jgi:hypothetical protein